MEGRGPCLQGESTEAQELTELLYDCISPERELEEAPSKDQGGRLVAETPRQSPRAQGRWGQTHGRRAVSLTGPHVPTGPARHSEAWDPESCRLSFPPPRPPLLKCPPRSHTRGHPLAHLCIIAPSTVPVEALLPFLSTPSTLSGSASSLNLGISH